MTAFGPKRRSESGFSTLEALVAVALIGLSLAPLLAIQTQITRTHARYEAARADAQMQENALEILSDLNPIAEPQGERRLSQSGVVTWRSVQISQRLRSTGYPVGDGLYEVALFRVDVEATDAKRRSPLRFSIERVGWERAQAGTDFARLPPIGAPPEPIIP
jgi:Tfp pilus assembly protein PilV